MTKTTAGRSPDSTFAVLGTERVATEDVILEATGWRTKRQRVPVHYLDWTIDGVALRSLLRLPDSTVPDERTFMVRGSEGDLWAVESLRALLHGYREIDDVWVRYSDGRTAILYCSQCGDLNCATITARIEFDASSVRWSSVAYQTGLSDTPGFPTFEPVTFTFARDAYESTIRGLLAGWRGQIDG